MLGALLALVALGAGILGYVYYQPQLKPIPPEELAQTAMSPEASTNVQERAVLELANSGEEAKVHLRQILEQTPKDEIKAAAVLAIGRVRDWDSMPRLFQILENFAENSWVRARAGSSVNILLGKNFAFQVTDPEEQQAEAIRQMKALYQAQMAANPNFMKKPAPAP